jgi:hypothetical protein
MNKESFLKISITFIVFFINKMIFATTIEKEIFFSAYLKGINLAKAEGKINIKPNILKLSFGAKTVGVFSLISEWKQTLSINALLINNKLKSQQYRSDDSRGNKKGHMYLNFENDIPKIISAQPDPREDNRREKINKNLLKNTIDPISGVLNLGLDGNCNQKEIIFDGKRRYMINASFIEEEIIKKNQFFAEDFNSIKCVFSIKKLEGYTEKEKKRYPGNGYIWYKKVGKDLFFPARIAIDTRWGEFLCLIKEKELKNESDSL